jgi:hypothetical protein
VTLVTKTGRSAGGILCLRQVFRRCDREKSAEVHAILESILIGGEELQRNEMPDSGDGSRPPRQYLDTFGSLHDKVFDARASEKQIHEYLGAAGNGTGKPDRRQTAHSTPIESRSAAA